jgi:hypothetical protein
VSVTSSPARSIVVLPAYVVPESSVQPPVMVSTVPSSAVTGHAGSGNVARPSAMRSSSLAFAYTARALAVVIQILTFSASSS